MTSLTGKQRQQEDIKMPFVLMVKENKEILFGKYDNAKNITKESKKSTWKNIQSQMEALQINIVPADKDWTYMRDVLWRNLIAAAKKKFDSKKKTGAGKIELSPLENAILDVIGIDSPSIQVSNLHFKDQNFFTLSFILIQGLAVDETWGHAHDTSTREAVTVIESLVVQPELPVPISSCSFSRTAPLKRSLTSASLAEHYDNDFLKLKSTKLKLEIEYLSLRNVNMQLQNTKLKAEINRLITGNEGYLDERENYNTTYTNLSSQ